MAKVKVWNDNEFEHRERFKGVELVIAPGASIEMDYEEAVEFKGQFTPPRVGGDDAPDPRFFKMIRVEQPKVIEPKPGAGLICHADGSMAANQTELVAKLLEFAGNRVVDPEDERVAAEKKAADSTKIASLEAQIAELRGMVERQSERGQRKAAAGG